MKQKGAVCQPGPALSFFVFRFENLISAPKSYRYFQETDPRAQLFEGRLTRVSFSFDKKHFLGLLSLLFLRTSIINLLTKKIKLKLLFKLSYLKSNFALTLGCLNPALNNRVQILRSYEVSLFARVCYETSRCN